MKRDLKKSWLRLGRRNETESDEGALEYIAGCISKKVDHFLNFSKVKAQQFSLGILMLRLLAGLLFRVMEASLVPWRICSCYLMLSLWTRSSTCRIIEHTMYMLYYSIILLLGECEGSEPGA